MNSSSPESGVKSICGCGPAQKVAAGARSQERHPAAAARVPVGLQAGGVRDLLEPHHQDRLLRPVKAVRGEAHRHPGATPFREAGRGAGRVLEAQGFVAPLRIRVVGIFDDIVEDRIPGVDLPDDVVLQVPGKGHAPERRPVPGQAVIAFRITEKVALRSVVFVGGSVRAADGSAVPESEATGSPVSKHRMEGGSGGGLPRHLRLQNRLRLLLRGAEHPADAGGPVDGVVVEE